MSNKLLNGPPVSSAWCGKKVLGAGRVSKSKFPLI
jgi:hypothetical protein